MFSYEVDGEQSPSERLTWVIGARRRNERRRAQTEALQPRSAALQAIGDGGERIAEAGTNQSHRRDGGDGNQRGNQPVLDRGDARLVLHQVCKKREQQNLLILGVQTRRTCNQTFKQM